MLDHRLFILQRFSALLMAPFVICHLAVMIYAVQGGLSAAEILSRTQGSFGWALFYGTFVIIASVHASIGLRVILQETLGVEGLPANGFTAVIFLLLLGLGVRAVWAVSVGGVS